MTIPAQHGAARRGGVAARLDATRRRRKRRDTEASGRSLCLSPEGFICGGINKNLRAIYRGSSAARSGGSINLLRSARLARGLQNRRRSSLYEARID